MKDLLAFDLESDGLLPELTTIHCIVTKDLTNGTIKRYVSDPTIVTVCDGSIDDAVHSLSNADMLVGHNIVNFDIPAIQKIYPDFKPKGLIRDTLLISRLIWTNLKDTDFARKKQGLYSESFKFYGQHGLKAWGYRLGNLKGEYADTTDWSQLDQEMLDYCVQDVEVTKSLWELIESKEYSEEAIQLEHDFAQVILRQMQFGFKFDVKKAADLYSTLVKRRLELKEELQSIFKGWTHEMKKPEYYEVEINGRVYREETKTKLVTTAYQDTREQGESVTKSAIGEMVRAGKLKTKHIEFNPSSRHNITRALKERYDWKPKEFTNSGDAKVDESILKDLHYPEAKLLAENFLIEKRIGQLAEGRQAWLKVHKEGRIYGSVITNGAVTGRCTHTSPNLAQVPSVKCYPKGHPKEEHPMFGAEGVYGADCRDLFTIDSGFKLVGADASGLELRCLAHYMAKEDDGAYVAVILDGDIHTVNMKAAGLRDRGEAKTFIYALLYGAGDYKIGTIINKGAAAGKALKAQFFKNLPALKILVNGVTAKAKSRKYLFGLDGRRLHIRSEHAALNTLLQSAGALIMKKALVYCDKLLQEAGYIAGVDYEFVANIHDEFQCQVKEHLADKVGKIMVKSMQLSGEHFNFRCPIDGEYKVGNSWLETH